MSSRVYPCRVVRLSVHNKQLLVAHYIQYLTLLHLSSSGLVVHIATGLLLQFTLCVTACLASIHIFHPSSRLSFQQLFVFRGHIFRLPSSVHNRAVRQRLHSVILITCPIQFHQLILTPVLIYLPLGLIRIISFDSTYDDQIDNINTKQD